MPMLIVEIVIIILAVLSLIHFIKEWIARRIPLHWARLLKSSLMTLKKSIERTYFANSPAGILRMIGVRVCNDALSRAPHFSATAFLHSGANRSFTVVAVNDRVDSRIVSQRRQLRVARIGPMAVVALDLLVPSIGIIDHDASAMRLLVYLEGETRQ
jgi:hypothetical protein